jgi:hypothetical protein
MTVFLTPGPAALLRGDVLPAHGRYGRPGFATLLRSIGDLWERDRDDADRAGGPSPSTSATGGRDRAPGQRRRGRDPRAPSASSRRLRPDARRDSAPRRSFRPRCSLALLLRHHRRTRGRRGHDGAGPSTAWREAGCAIIGRRLRALLDRRALARAPLREDALRQRALARVYAAGLPGHRSRYDARSPASSATTSCAR